MAEVRVRDVAPVPGQVTAPAQATVPAQEAGSALQEAGDAMTAAVLVAFLQAGRVVDHASSLLLLPAAALSLLEPAGSVVLALLGATLVFAMAEKYHAWRVALDAGLFAVLLRHPEQTQQFDAALADMLGRPAPLAGRSMASRRQGARRLLRRQALCLGAQMLATAALFLAQFTKMTLLA